MAGDDLLKNIRQEVSKISTSIASLLHSSKMVEYDKGFIKIGVYYKFHKDMLDEDRSRRIIEDVAEKVLNDKLRVECVLLEAPKKAELKDAANENLVSLAQEIF